MPAIFLHPAQDGLVILVRAQPRARKNSTNSLLKGTLKISVQAPPEDGKANLAIAELLYKVLKLIKNQIKLIQGETSRDKKFLI